MSIEIKKSHEGRFHEWPRFPTAKKFRCKIKQAQRSPDAAVRKEARFADNARHWNQLSHDRYSDQRRRLAKLDKRFRARVREKGPLGMKTTFLGNTKQK